MIQKADVTFKYSFRAPDAFFYGAAPLGISPNGLYCGGSDAAPASIGEITIPLEGGTSTTINPPTRINMAGVGAGPKIGGTLVDGIKVVLSGYDPYNTGGLTKSHTVFPDANWTPLSPYPNSVSGGYMGHVPLKWQNLLGGKAFTGQCSLSIISQSSSGPALMTFNPDDVETKNPIPASVLLYYPESNPLEMSQSGVANQLYQRADPVVCCAWIDDSILFFGSHGSGKLCYGETSQCPDPVWPYKGDHSYPYNPRVWAYDANDLLKVKSGLMQPWQVRPYAYWDFAILGIPADKFLPRAGSAAFDPKTNRVYLTPRWGDPPLNIYVFEIKGGITSPPPVELLKGELTLTRQLNGDYLASGILKKV